MRQFNYLSPPSKKGFQVCAPSLACLRETPRGCWPGSLKFAALFISTYHKNPDRQAVSVIKCQQFMLLAKLGKSLINNNALRHCLSITTLVEGLTASLHTIKGIISLHPQLAGFSTTALGNSWTFEGETRERRIWGKERLLQAIRP